MRSALLWIPLLASFSLAGHVFGQSEPVDKNTGGPYVGGLFAIGQSTSSDSSSPGPAWLLGVDVGLGVKRDAWNRVEFGLELDKGSLSYELKDQKVDVDLDLDMMALLKVGYGYSLGDHVFGVFRAGIGVAQLGYKGASDTGVAYLVGWDAVFPASERLDMSVGFNLRSVQAKFSELADSSSQINVPTLSLGARVRL